MGVGDIYQVVDVQELDEQRVLNVYYYEQRQTIVPLMGQTIAATLAYEFNEQKVDTIAAAQNEALTHIEVQAVNLFDPEDFGIAVSGVSGAGTENDSMPPFVTFSTKFTLPTRAIRPGGKRIAGVGEGVQVGGVVTNPDTIPLLEDMDADLESVITGGLIIQDPIWWPCVVQRIREEGEEGDIVYRLPTSPGEAIFAEVLESLTSLVLGSMLTRKRGKGV